MKAVSQNYSTVEVDFVKRCLVDRKRLDGRQLTDYRSLKLQFGVDYGHCEVLLGNTRVLAQVSSEVVKPTLSRPTEGQLHFNVELTSMASSEYDNIRSSKSWIEISRFIERCLKDSKPVDVESLCIVAEEQVWSIRVDLHVLDDNGNVLDCACIAGIAALKHFRRPCVTVTGDNVIIHPIDEKPPVPLNVYHIPICVSFGMATSNERLFVDPTKHEEAVLNGRMIIASNTHGELCFIDIRGVTLDVAQILQCSKIALVKVIELTEIIQNALTQDSNERFPPSKKGARQRRDQKKNNESPALITKTNATSSSPSITQPDNHIARDGSSQSPDVDMETANTKGENQSPAIAASEHLERTSSIGFGGKTTWQATGEPTNGASNDVDMTATRSTNPVIIKSGSDDDDGSEEDEVLILGDDVKDNATSSSQRMATRKTPQMEAKTTQQETQPTEQTVPKATGKRATRKKRNRKKKATN